MHAEITKPIDNLDAQVGQNAFDLYESNELANIIEGSRVNEAGLHTVEEGTMPKLREYLGSLGILAEKPSEASIIEGIHRAKNLVETGQAEQTLSQMEYIDPANKELIRTRSGTLIDFSRHGELYVDSSLIKGAGGFIDSWLDKSSKSYQNRKGDRVTTSSVAVVEDYATRETQLPPLEDYGALRVLLTSNGVTLYSSVGAHRTAAAKLRQEPLRFESVYIIDAR